MTVTTDLTADTARARAVGLIARKRRLALAVPVLLTASLAHVWVAFDVGSAAEPARMDNARILVAGSQGHKVDVTRDGRSGSLDIARVDDRIVLALPVAEAPAWVNASDSRVAVTTPGGRLAVTRKKDAVFRCLVGWELFRLTLDSPDFGASLWSILTRPQIDPARGNLARRWADLRGNPMRRSAGMASAMGETVLVAFLGTVGAAAPLALPLAFPAARTFAPLGALRFAFIRGVDGLIWPIFPSRAFGPGSLTGTLAIPVTDTGSFGMTFSVALGNVDGTPIEGVRPTGARAARQHRSGVVARVTPVFPSPGALPLRTGHPQRHRDRGGHRRRHRAVHHPRHPDPAGPEGRDQRHRPDGAHGHADGQAVGLAARQAYQGGRRRAMTARARPLRPRLS